LAACLVVPDAILAQDTPATDTGTMAGGATTTSASSATTTTPTVESDAAPEVKTAKRGTTVAIADFTYTPPELHVKPGTTVTWTNDGPSDHTVTADDSSYDSSTMGVGATFSHTYDTVGTYHYICAFHEDMTGDVVVSKSGGSNPDSNGGGTGGTDGTTPGTTSDGTTPGTTPGTTTTDPSDPTNVGTSPDTGEDTLILLAIGLGFLLGGAVLLRVADWY
jgi:LPXTG-motif cell wall-anchored protein